MKKIIYYYYDQWRGPQNILLLGQHFILHHNIVLINNNYLYALFKYQHQYI